MGFAKLSGIVILFLSIISIPFITEYTDNGQLKADYQITDDIIVDTYLHLDGVNDFVYINNLSIFPNHNIEIDMEIIDFNFNDPFNWIISGGSTSERFYVFYDSNYQLIFRIGSTFNVNTNITLPSERFLFRLDVRSNGVHIYINNVYQSFYSFNYNGSESPTYLGSIYASDYFANINVYDFKYSDISQNEITHLDFSEGSGTMLNDIVGNNDGTIVGGTWQNEIIPGTDSYQVFDNFRSSAPDSNPLGFIQQFTEFAGIAVDYFETFMNFIRLDLPSILGTDKDINDYGINGWWFRNTDFIEEE